MQGYTPAAKMFLNALKSWFFFRHSHSMGFPLNFNISIGPKMQRNINLFSPNNLFLYVCTYVYQCFLLNIQSNRIFAYRELLR